MSENTINAALHAMGFPRDEVTRHGCRAIARKMMHERLGFDPHVVEAQLAHSVRDSLGGLPGQAARGGDVVTLRKVKKEKAPS